MRYIFLLLFVPVALLPAGCAHHPPKATSQIYAGDGPGVHYTDPQAAGGPLGTGRYH